MRHWGAPELELLAGDTSILCISHKLGRYVVLLMV